MKCHKVKLELFPDDIGRIQAMLTCVMCGVIDKDDKEKAALLYSVIEDAWAKRTRVKP